MADRWRLRVRSDQKGLPSAIIDVEVARSFIVPLSEAQESLKSAFGELGWTFAIDALDFANSVAPSQRQFISMDWREATEGQFPNRPFAKILEVLDKHVSWRVEGSADTGFWGILSSAGVEVRFDLSETKVQSVADYITAKTVELEADTVTPQQQRDLDLALCKAMHESVSEVMGCYLVKEMKRQEQDEARRKQQQEQQENSEDKIRGGLHGESSDGGETSGSIGRIGGPYVRERG